MMERERSIIQRIEEAGLPRPVSVIFAAGGGSIAVEFRIEGVIETVEGVGDSDASAADDVVRQLRPRFPGQVS